MKNKLRKYQQAALDKIANRKYVALEYGRGSGKTLTYMIEASILKQNILDKWTIAIFAKQKEVFEKALRENAVPPIKGEITIGKIKRRGIKISKHDELMHSETWLTQRGIQISEKIIIESKFTL